MATNRNSTIYANAHVNKYIMDARDYRGSLLPIPFAHTVVSGETGGASAGVQDSVNLCVLPAKCMVIALFITAENIWASAGSNGTLQLGDATDDDRYMAAVELYSSGGGPIGTAAVALPVGLLAYAGQNYRPTADVIVLATWKTANPVVGKGFKGCFLVVPGA